MKPIATLGVLLLAAGLSACGGAPSPTGPTVHALPPAPDAPLRSTSKPGLLDDPPHDTVALGRVDIPIPSLRDLMPPPLSDLADECGLDGRIDRIDAALTRTLAMEVEITGTPPLEAAQCMASNAGGIQVTRSAPDRLRLSFAALVAPTDAQRSPSAPAASGEAVRTLVRRVQELSEKSPLAVVAAQGPHALELTGDPDHVVLRVRLPAGMSAAAVAWWKGPAHEALASIDTSQLAVGAEGPELVMEITPPDETSPIALALQMRTLAVEAFRIPSASMFPTLHLGDHLFVDKTVQPPQRGDIVVFDSPDNPGVQFIKRIVAMPGETLEIVDGRPIVGKTTAIHCAVGRYEVVSQTDRMPLALFVEKLDGRAYLIARNVGLPERSCTKTANCEVMETCRAGRCSIIQGPYRVAPGEVFVVGDNRDNSFDSRAFGGYLGKGIPIRSIDGRAGIVYLALPESGEVDFDRLFVDAAGKPKLPSDASPALREALDRCLATP